MTEKSLQPADLREAYALLSSRQFDDACRAFRQISRARPNDPRAYNGLGLSQLDLGKLAEAKQAFLKAVSLRADYPEPVINLGLIQMHGDDLSGAIRYFLRALEINSTSVPALNNLGTVYTRLERHEEALDCYRTAVRLLPTSAAAHANVGLSLRFLCKYAEALESFRCAIELNPQSVDALIGLGLIAFDYGKLEEAIAYFDQALAIEPQSPNARNNRAHALLTAGNLEQGWLDFEARWSVREIARWARAFPQPRWQGERTPDKKLLVWAEQGIGDQLFYARMLPDLKDTGPKLLLECDARLIPLLQRTWPWLDVVARTDPPDRRCFDSTIDYQIPLASVSRWLRPSIESIPSSIDNLCADLSIDRARVRRGDASLVVGISWKGPLARARIAKDSQLEKWEPILSCPNVRFVNLQYGESEDDIDRIRRNRGIEIESPGEFDRTQDIDALASAIKQCDLVISVSNSTAHLAAALGVPTFVLVQKGNGKLWCWFRTSGSTPWYPSATLFFQDSPGEWDAPIQAAARALKRKAKERRRPFWKFWATPESE